MPAEGTTDGCTRLPLAGYAGGEPWQAAAVEDGAERAALEQRAWAVGATDADIAASLNLGELVLDLTLRPRSGRTVGDVIEELGADPGAVLRLLTATGLPTSFDDPLSTAEVAAVRMLATVSRDLLGEDVTVQLGRVSGLAMSRIAEAVVTAFRLRFELPQRTAGIPYIDLVDRYAAVVDTVLPAFVESLDVLLRQNILAVAARMWSTDEEGAAVTLPRSVGFVDLVGYTAAASRMTVRELTATLIEFDDRTAAAALRWGGQIVKTIGDEAMFVTESPVSACRIGLELIDAFGDGGTPVRVGIAAGDVVSVFGDVYGPDVNLAARLVSAAEPSTALVSESVAAACNGEVASEPVGPLALKGFAEPVVAHRLLAV